MKTLHTNNIYKCAEASTKEMKSHAFVFREFGDDDGKCQLIAHENPDTRGDRNDYIFCQKLGKS